MLSQVLSQEEELHWLALKLVPGLGARFSKRLLDRFRTPQAIFHASRTELEKAGISGAVAQSIASGCSFEDAAAIPLVFLVTYDMLVLQGHLKAGEWVLVTGVSSGVGVATEDSTV